MMSKLSTIITAAIITAVATVGVVYIVQNTKTNDALNKNTSSYEDANYTLQYPAGYTVTKPTESFPALTVEKTRTTRIEIFKMEDFGERPFGFEGNETQNELDEYMPKESVVVGTNNKYDVWMFYPTGDNTAKEEIEAIVESIQVE